MTRLNIYMQRIINYYKENKQQFDNVGVKLILLDGSTIQLKNVNDNGLYNAIYQNVDGVIILRDNIVRDSDQNKGYGTRYLTFMVDVFNRCRCKGIVGKMGDSDNVIKLTTFYEKCGFEVYGDVHIRLMY